MRMIKQCALILALFLSSSKTVHFRSQHVASSAVRASFAAFWHVILCTDNSFRCSKKGSRLRRFWS